MSPAPSTRFTIGPDTFRHGALSAADAFHCVRRIAPVVKNTGALVVSLAASEGETDAAERIADVIQGGAPLFQAFAEMGEDDANYVIARCMAATELLDGEIWVPTWDPEIQAPAVERLRLIHVLRICYAVLRTDISVFFLDVASSLTELGLIRPAMSR